MPPLLQNAAAHLHLAPRTNLLGTSYTLSTSTTMIANFEITHHAQHWMRAVLISAALVALQGSEGLTAVYLGDQQGFLTEGKEQ